MTYYTKIQSAFTTNAFMAIRAADKAQAMDIAKTYGGKSVRLELPTNATLVN